MAPSAHYIVHNLNLYNVSCSFVRELGAQEGDFYVGHIVIQSRVFFKEIWTVQKRNSDPYEFDKVCYKTTEVATHFSTTGFLLLHS
jgi:hypothetical protein